MSPTPNYNPTAGTFAATASPATARYAQTATLLNDGTVLVAGGASASGSTLSSAEIYTPAPSISSLSPTSGAVGARVTITGTNFGATQGAVTFGGTSATIQTWTPASISVQVPNSLSPRSVQVVVSTSLASSNSASFTVTSLTLPSLSLSSAPVGALVFLSGSGFGATQQTSSVTFNGTSATASSWSDGFISVSVPTGATTGNVVVQVDGAVSNPLVFTVVAETFPPGISATIFPSPNASNWNNTNVTISYACNAGGNATNGGVPLTQNSCSAPRVISTEGSNQQITGTVTDAGGNSSSVITTLNIDKTPPLVTITSPADQSSYTSSTVSITGTVSDSLSGLASTSCNGTVAPVTNGSFTCNISLNAGVNLVMIQATDIAGNMAGSTLHLTLTAPLPAPASLQITPGNANVLVGATRQFTAVDQLGIPRSDAAWTVDNSNIATISTDASPILTGFAAGTVTITASVGNISAQIQVHVLGGTSLPVGTVLWSAPQVPGFTALQIVQAVPTSNGTPDLYSIEQDGNLNILIRALTGDGQQLWQTPIPSGLGQFINQFTPAMGDSLGGLLLVVSNQGILDLDGQSGAISWQNTTTTSGLASVGQDGSVLTSDGNGELVKINPQSGQNLPIYSLLLNSSTIQTGTCINNLPVVTGVVGGVSPSAPSGIVVDAAGNAFFTVSSSSGTAILGCVEGDPTLVSSGSAQHLLVKIAPDGTTTQTSLPINVPLQSTNGLRVLAPDGNGGALVQWIPQSASTSAYVMATSTGVTYPAPLGGLTGLVLGENGNALGTDNSSTVAFDHLNSGQTQWTYQPSQGVNSIFAVHGGGASIFDNQMNQITINSSGNPGSPSPLAFSSIQPSLLGTLNGITPTGSVALISALQIDFADGGWDAELGGLQKSSKSEVLPYLASLPSCSGAQTPCVGDALRTRSVRFKRWYQAIALIARHSCSASHSWGLRSSHSLRISREDTTSTMQRAQTQRLATFCAVRLSTPAMSPPYNLT